MLKKDDDSPAPTTVGLSRKMQRYIDIAKRQAEQSIYGIYKHGSVLVKGGRIINVAYNKNNTTSFGKKFRENILGRATKHAEINVIYNIDKNTTTGATVYVVRVGKSGDFRLSKPCSMCEEVLKFCGIKKVVYSTGNGFEICKL